MLAGSLLAIFGSLSFYGTASADVVSGEIMCQTLTNNHMSVSEAYVTQCVDAGLGNIGNGQNDDFLKRASGTGYVDVGGGAFTQETVSQTFTRGTFAFDSSLWTSYQNLAIGFKFGTGNEPDEWFIYKLVQGVSSGNWNFHNILVQGGGLSHIELYSYPKPPNGVPEPGTLALVGLALAGVGALRRRRA